MHENYAYKFYFGGKVMRKKSMRFMSLFIILAIIFSFAACTLTQDEPDVTTAGTSNSTGTSETTGGSG